MQSLSPSLLPWNDFISSIEPFFFLSLSWLFNGLVVMSDYSGVVDGTVETVFPVS